MMGKRKDTKEDIISALKKDLNDLIKMEGCYVSPSVMLSHNTIIRALLYIIQK